MFSDDRPMRCVDAALDFCKERAEQEFAATKRDLHYIKRLRATENRMKTEREKCRLAGRVVSDESAKNSPWMMSRESARATCEKSAKDAARLSLYYAIRAVVAAIVGLEIDNNLSVVADARKTAYDLALETINGNL